jgi:hypothetical protein
MQTPANVAGGLLLSGRRSARSDGSHLIGFHPILEGSAVKEHFATELRPGRPFPLGAPNLQAADGKSECFCQLVLGQVVAKNRRSWLLGFVIVNSSGAE